MHEDCFDLNPVLTDQVYQIILPKFVDSTHDCLVMLMNVVMLNRSNIKALLVDHYGLNSMFPNENRENIYIYVCDIHKNKSYERLKMSNEFW